MIYGWKLHSKCYNLGFDFTKIGFDLKEIKLVEVRAEHPSDLAWPLLQMILFEDLNG